MDAADPSTTSKVIVQCTDPSDIFGLLEPRLSSRTPLRSLHWKSPSRPLRSIPTLNIWLTREERRSDGSLSNVRRHQIPGLRETPYVKLFLLRCDDKETYREKARKEVRQWVKSVTPAPDGKPSQEDHDAFEWLIVHVVLPNTPAASQPRTSKHISLETSDSTDSVNSKSKWSGNSSSTIYDKLRADFNSSSKTPINRVVQVRIVDAEEKQGPLSTGEVEEQWRELVESLKACILRSFDARVTQYELDIRERDGQRNLPGWNFCTFLILKEGLARGFESVGLLEDALTVYDELSLSLDNVVQDQAARDHLDDAGALLPFSRTLKSLIRAAIDPSKTDHSGLDQREETLSLKSVLTADRDKFPFDIEGGRYRDLILSNQVSALDLRIHLFTRQLEILLRMAHAASFGADDRPQESRTAAVNLNMAADLGERAVQFVSLAARSLRLDLYQAWGGQEGLSREELHTQQVVTGNIVATWVWCAIMQILTHLLPFLGPDMNRWADPPVLEEHELLFSHEKAHSDGPPVRPSKLNDMSSPPLTLQPLSRDSTPQEAGSEVSDNATVRYAKMAKPGAERLALWTAKLVLQARKVVEGLESTQAWARRMKRIVLSSPAAVNGYANEDTSARGHEEGVVGLDSCVLRTVATSHSAFVQLYGVLSVFAYRLLAPAPSEVTARQVLIDLIQLEYARQNDQVTAWYLASILHPLPRYIYHPSDRYLLPVYAECLRRLGRHQELARCLVACLQQSFQKSPATPSYSQHTPSLKGYVEELFALAQDLPSVTLPLEHLFQVSRIARNISHRDAEDGFRLSLFITPVVEVRTPAVDRITLRLAALDGNEPSEIALQSSRGEAIGPEMTEVPVEASMTTQGWYSVEELQIQIGHLSLVHHFRPREDDEERQPPPLRSGTPNVPNILVYPRPDAFALRVTTAPVVHLAEPRHMAIHLDPGTNNVIQCQLKLRAATAGLRLQIHDIRLQDPRLAKLKVAREREALMIHVDDLQNRPVDMEMPYSIENQSGPSVTLRLEAIYTTDRGTFHLYDTAKVKVILPVTVNVQDVYRSSHMYSRFTISPSTLVPLRLTQCAIEENDHFTTPEVDGGGGMGDALMIFPKQPANWTVRLSPKRSSNVTTGARRLTLVLDFQCLDELILTALEREFLHDVAKSPYASARRLLSSHFLDRIQARWTEQDLEVAGLTQEFEVWNVKDMDWGAVLCAFEQDTRAQMEDWLRTWHSLRPPVDLSVTTLPVRQLKLYVDVPPPPIILTARLELVSLQTDEVAPVGQPLLAELVIIAPDDPDHGELTLTFELIAPAEAWLIGGRRKGTLPMTEHTVRSQVVLFPQHTGHLLLPTIDIKCKRPMSTSPGSGLDWADVTVEVDNKTAARSILIVPGLQSTTIELSTDSPHDTTGRIVTSTFRNGFG